MMGCRHTFCSAGRCGWVGLIVLLVAGLIPSPSRAADLPERGWETLVVGLLPVRNHPTAADELFAVQVPSTRRSERWERLIVEELSRLDQVRTQSPDALSKRLRAQPDYQERIRLGQTFQKLAMEAFEAVQPKRALEFFDRALAAYNRVHGAVTEPIRVADIHFHRGLVLVEAGRDDAAHLAMRNALLLHPSRRFRPGYFSKRVESALRRAQLDLASEQDPNRYLVVGGRHASIARRARLSVVLAAAIVGAEKSRMLQLTLWDSRSRGVLLSERIPLSGGTDAAKRRLGRLLSAWHTCNIEARIGDVFASPPRPLGLFVEVGYAHSVLLKHPTRAAFHSPGAYIGLTWEPSDNLLLFARTTQMVSLPDTNRDLLESFVVGRLALGVGLSGGSRNIRGFLEVGVEAALAFSDIRLSRDPDCKHFGLSHARCGELDAFEAPAVWFGFVVGAGLRWRIIRSWYMRAAVDMSIFVADTSLIRSLNFPLTVSLGLGKRF